MKIQVSVVLERDEDRFHAYCPAFQGLHIDGRSEEQALERTRTALELYMNSLSRHDDPLPVGPYCVVEDDMSPSAEYRVPADAILKNIEIPWPSSMQSGNS